VKIDMAHQQQQCEVPQDSNTECFVKSVQTLLVQMGMDKILPEIAQIKVLISAIEQKHVELEQSLTFTQSEHANTKQTVSGLVTENQFLNTKLDFMESRLMELEKHQSELKQRSIDAQYRSMKNNLIFHRLPESKTENTKQVLQDFMNTYLKIDPTDSSIWISRAHRFGQLGADGTRPIVAVFIQGQDVVLRNAKHLAQTKYFITNQLPPELAERKRQVQPIFKQAKAQGKRPKYIGKGDAVMVDGTTYEAPTIPLCTIPISEIIRKSPNMGIHPTHPVTDQGNKFISHIATVTSPMEISMAVTAIKHTSNRGTSTATHNMFAARILKNGRMLEYSNDDGEHGGSRHILQEMQNANITNRVVVVSRWFSGKQLGRKRFNIISQCTRAAFHVLLTTVTTQQGHQILHSTSPSASATSSNPVLHSGSPSIIPQNIQQDAVGPSSGAYITATPPVPTIGGYMFSSPIPVTTTVTTLSPPGNQFNLRAPTFIPSAMISAQVIDPLQQPILMATDGSIP
jgi:regulator of replication initiation timing